jgi:hypothetical protein
VRSRDVPVHFVVRKSNLLHGMHSGEVCGGHGERQMRQMRRQRRRGDLVRP